MAYGPIGYGLLGSGGFLPPPPPVPYSSRAGGPEETARLIIGVNCTRITQLRQKIKNKQDPRFYSKVFQWIYFHFIQ
ncbi:hypothetical protein RBU61_03000 [Tissierella sp. MB52-C2]|uniref:hypothetical protein n=1 Tax=Tissierella sp. MB52-C2 TaxID=3070999 RepID=UPI00280BC996|nr:hypothetical protein [Tissierella sp. MB52-C2]WMM25652.1 hypothetical protein RBU61_03000 [Tissierella sp. MB52-C2]